MSTAQSGSASLRDQRVARTIDREVAPVWHDRFSRMLFRDLEIRPQTFALDVHCGSGRTTAALLERLDDSSRVLAVEEDAAMVTLAKTRVRPEWKSRVYFKSGNFDDVTGMGDDTYDLTVANLVLSEEVHEWRAAIKEMHRVTKPGGQLVATVPLHGTWAEVEDLFEEVMRDYQLRESIRMLQHVRRLRPRPRAIVDALMEANVDPDDYVLEQEQFQLLFRSGREFLFAPVIEHGPLRLWKAMLGKAKDPQKLFWRFKETIDTYYAGRVLAVTIQAGVIRVRKPDGKQPRLAVDYWSRYPELDRIFNGERISAADTDEDDLDFEMDLDLDVDIDEGEDEDGEDDEDEAPTEEMVVPSASVSRTDNPLAGADDDDIDTDAIFAALQTDEDDDASVGGDDFDDLDDLDEVFGDTFNMDETGESAPVVIPELPKAPAPPATLKSVSPRASDSKTNMKIPPPPPTGVHKKLPPLPKPKKKKG